MEHKHFSHPHGLTFHQNKLKSEKVCSGCKFPCYQQAYVCWECNFFLHEECFQATRSIDHPSHPAHPLNLVPYPTYPSGRFVCDSCNQPGFGFSFGCSKCEYDLHLHCSKINVESSTSSIPNPSQSQPKQINHKSHPQHSLHFLSTSPYSSGEFGCNACGEAGKASVFNCSVCQYDLHEKCAALPETMKRKDHEHQLILMYSVDQVLSTGTVFDCDVCFRNIRGNLWMYYCKECQFGTHVNCVMAKARSQMEVVLEQNLAAQVELIKIQNAVNLNTAHANIIANAFYGGHRHYRF
ncbi:putative zinc finger, PHD-type, DC1, Zinc finger, RING/FYVE/PHD-type [Heracleum sosnowskyi]|uniref:Zinc finger, PHD-type, DC1, Zinc finger, RING/FYVE/PHD-type n=1 Tax=Heracleum sosnowskyi TaxID=360622 RepID=A0AAD8HXS7_9APIA|nr:putative zinc finger, PHD-type, DC1, Zinc finger, RING/FYVE/PHD-type [Heracleum sosnowskyi]